MKTKNNYWSIAFWILQVGWVVGAALYMYRVKAGFLTNYLSDLAFPPWFYIYIRGLRTGSRDVPNLFLFKNWFGLSPERAAISIFIVGVVSEFMTLIWPNGPITGTYDTWDILAYALGLLPCYLIDKFSTIKDRT